MTIAGEVSPRKKLDKNIGYLPMLSRLEPQYFVAETCKSQFDLPVKIGTVLGA